MGCIDELDVLKVAVESGILDITTIRQNVEMNERKKYLEKHEQKVWQSKDGYWCTYLHNDEGRRLIKKKSRDELNNAIIKHEKSGIEEPTVEKVFTEWMNEKMQFNEISKSTYDRYVNDFKRFYNDIKHRKIRYIEVADLTYFVKNSIAEKELTAKAYSNLRTLLIGIWKYAKEHKYTDLSISTFMGDLQVAPKAFKHRQMVDEEQVFTADEEKLIIDYINQNTDILNLGVKLAFLTGMRAGEISTLKWEDWQKDILYIRRRELRCKNDNGKGYTYTVEDNTKGYVGARKLVITKEVIATLSQCKLMNGKDEFIISKNGKRIYSHDYTNRLYRICDKVGIPRRSLHKARKTYGSKLLNAGVTDILIENQMGHTKIETTKDYYWYRNTTIEEDRKTLEKVLKY